MLKPCDQIFTGSALLASSLQYAIGSSLSDDRGFVCFGQTDDVTYSETSEIFDFKNNVFFVSASFSIHRIKIESATGNDGYSYFIGGFSGSQNISYKPSFDSFKTLNDSVSPRTDNVSFTSLSGNIISTCGTDGGVYNLMSEIYVPKYNYSYTDTNSISLKKAASGNSSEGTIIAGGENDSIPNMSYIYSEISATSYNAECLVIGGKDDLNSSLNVIIKNLLNHYNEQVLF